jgi:hypothetical protein
MSQEKYIGMDVHQATISVMVAGGKLIMECLLGGWPTSRQRHIAREEHRSRSQGWPMFAWGWQTWGPTQRSEPSPDMAFH